MSRSSTYIATPPGATIKEQLIDRGMSQKEFAARMDMSEKHISKLINGDVQLTADVSVRLETVLGVPASFWNNLEAIYREKLIKIEAENSMEDDEDLARRIPYSEMAKLGWVKDTRNIKEKVINLRQFFGVVKLSLLADEQITKIACRKLAITEKSDIALISWAQEARILSRDIHTSPINIKRLRTAIPDIRKMTNVTPAVFCPKLKETLGDCGVVLIFLPHLKGSFLQGATFEEGNRIVIGLTVRGRDADIFWFSLFHELAHIILGHVDKTDGLSEQDEEKADTWSADMLIDPQSFAEFCNIGDYSEQTVVEFSKNQGIAPGIVVGRLQHERLIKYNSMLNSLKDQYMITGLAD